MGTSHGTEAGWQYQDHKALVGPDRPLLAQVASWQETSEQNSNKQGIEQTIYKFINWRQSKGHCSELQKISAIFTNSFSWLPMYTYVAMHAKRKPDWRT